MKKYKYLIAMKFVILCGLPSTASAFTEVSNGSIGDLLISGTFVKSDPTWQWQIPSGASSLASLTANSLDGVYNTTTNQTTYNLLSSDVEFLQGHMISASRTGGTGLTPSITFGGMSLNEDNSETLTAPTQTPSSGAQVVIGFNKDVGVVRTISGNSFATGNSARAYPLWQELITDTTPWSTIGTSANTTSLPISDLFTQLADSTASNVQASYGLSATSVQLVANAGTDVSTWSVPLSIVIQVN
ncbi:hypothetical protein ACMAZD_21815 [Vibrio sp. nBUS_14]|uniref:F4 family fimbrial subunit n=1 Tax=Vibrio sp. nBUS_14 TaxID=3395321 RepID=UPI003EBBBCBF